MFAKVDSEVDIIYNKANEGESDNDEDDVAEGEDTEGDAARLGYKSFIDLTSDDKKLLTFASEDFAYQFYYTYGKWHGFGIRKDEVKHDEKENIIMREFVCNKEGLKGQ